VNSVHHVLRHGEWRPLGSVQATPSGETHEVVSTLGVACWSQRDGVSCAGCHVIAVFLVCLGIGSKLDMAMLAVIDFEARDQATRTRCLGDNVGWWEYIEPELATKIYHFHDHHGGHAEERYSVAHSSGVLFESLNVPFGLWDMLIILCDSVQSHADVHHVASHRVELVVDESESQSESLLLVEFVGGDNGGDDACHFPVLEHLDCAKLDVLGDRDKKQLSIDKHCVNAE
jgi:hypothetical protein